MALAPRLTALFLLLAAGFPAAAQKEPSIIPRPQSVSPQSGAFRLSPSTPIVHAEGDADSARVAGTLAEFLGATLGKRPAVLAGAPRDGAINLVRHGGGPDEAHRLEVAPKRITLASATPAGLFRAGTTLWQLASGRGTRDIPAVKIVDAPRFAWRGVMLDSARHYQSPEFILRFIDAMALHKLNVLHWHLTDDQAWRLEIRQYPQLTDVGAWRVPAGQAPRADLDAATGQPRRYGGFYSQETVRRIVAYAAERHITVVPEIEMPGHASATIVAYPALASTATPPTAVPSDWGVYPNAYNLDDATFAFLENVLLEVMELFPSKYIHVGGDEVEKEQWSHWPAAQARMKELGLTDPAALQVYFTQRIGRFLQSKGRRLVGWDEILQPGLPVDSVVMSWRGIDGALAAASKGHDTILSPHPTLYFDHRQDGAADEPPGRGSVISLEEVYRFEPMPAALKPGERGHVLGLQANIWTEHIRTEERVAHMAWPRAAAIAELGWSEPARRDYRNFVRRLAEQLPRYEALGIGYADSAFAVRPRLRHGPKPGRVQIELSTASGVGDIRYTLDGKDPTAKSPVYRAPLAVAAKGELRAAAFSGQARLSRPRAFALAEEHAWKRKSQELKLCSEHIALSLEDDAPLAGSRAAFLVDIQNPCWIFPDVDLERIAGIEAAVGQLPFNFQIGELVKKISFAKPSTPEGELQVRLGGCEGDIAASLPLAPAARSFAVTTLPRAKLSGSGRRDVCLRFSQPALEPMWVIDWIRLIPRAPVAAVRPR